MLDAGFHVHVAKPAEPSELLAAVTALAHFAPGGGALTQRRQRRATTTEARRVQYAPRPGNTPHAPERQARDRSLRQNRDTAAASSRLPADLHPPPATARAPRLRDFVDRTCSSVPFRHLAGAKSNVDASNGLTTRRASTRSVVECGVLTRCRGVGDRMLGEITCQIWAGPRLVDRESGWYPSRRGDARG